MTDDDHPFERLPIADQRFDTAAVDAYAAITDDFNPIHCDPVFAAKTEFGRMIVHGTLVVAPLWRHLGGRLTSPVAHDVRFLRPTPIDATVSYWQRPGKRGREFAIRLEDGTTVVSIVEADGLSASS